ncbi:hypothetical protein BC827DRAFT_62019 [Russula dissimulans]|nr:hypothetical protein BC827DRAFT_62019 [Russula dissimulans]
MVGKFLREFAQLRERIQGIYDDFEAAVRQREKQRDQAATTAKPPSVSGHLIKRQSQAVSSNNNIQGRIGTPKSINITEWHSPPPDLQKIHAPSSTSSFPIWSASETQLGSEELVMEDPEDWAVILKEMQNNVQSRAASLLGLVQNDLGDRLIVSHKSRPSGSKGAHLSIQSNLTLELRRLEIQLLMQIASFTPPDLCPPHEYLQAVKLTPSYPIVLSGYSWEVTVRRVTNLFESIDVSSMETGSPEAASKLFDLSQTLEDLCMHHYSYTVATWALFLRRGLYNSDKDMHRRDLALVLCLKARVLTALGRNKAAMTVVSEAVQACYEDEALQGVQLAKALLTQAPLLNAAGRKSEAKVTARQMVSILEAPGEDKPHLKRLLSLARASLSNILLDMEEYDEALAVAQDAVKSARSLIGAVDSRSALSIALLIKARILAARGENGTAYTTAVQAVRHLRELTSERPVFTTFLAHALVLSSRYLQAAGFHWEARKSADEAVDLHRALHTSAAQPYAQHYAEAVGQLVQLRVRMRMADSDSDGRSGSPPDADVFDMAQHAAGLFREASIRDSDALATVLLVIASGLFEAAQVQEAAAPAEEAVAILRPRWKRNPREHAPRFVRALEIAAACRPSTEAGLEYAMEAVEAHRPRKDLGRDVHERILTHLLMDVFLRLRELGREVEAIPYKTEAARLNVDVVESVDPPPATGAAHSKGLSTGIMEYGLESEDEEDI